MFLIELVCSLHIHVQIQVELDRKAVRVLSGFEEHVAIATSITNSVATSSPRRDLGVRGSGLGLDRVGRGFRGSGAPPAQPCLTWVRVGVGAASIVWAGESGGEQVPRLGFI